MMVGDDLIHDIGGANKWACTLCWCKLENTEKGLSMRQTFVPDGCISSIQELPNYLQNNIR